MANTDGSTRASDVLAVLSSFGYESRGEDTGLAIDSFDQWKNPANNTLSPTSVTGLFNAS